MKPPPRRPARLHRFPTPSRRGALLWIPLLAALTALSAAAEEPATGDGPAKGAAASARPQPASGWRVFVDPQTGEIRSRPTAEQRRAVQRAESRSMQSFDGLTPFPLLRAGTRIGVGVDLEGRFLSSTVIVRTGEGELVSLCLDGEVRRPRPPTPPPER